jgi:hypothetical protein
MNGHEHIKHAIDGVSMLAAFVSVIGMIPAVLAVFASILSIVWSMIRISEYLKSRKEGKAKFID